MAGVHCLDCCGILELSAIRGNEDADGMIYDLSYEGKEPFIIFSDIAPYKHGPKLVKRILEKRLGTVIEIPTQVNGNSRNRLKMWVWSVSKTRLYRYTRKLDEADTERYYYRRSY